MAKTFKRTAEPVSLNEALSIAILLTQFEIEICSKRTSWYKELCQVQKILAGLKEGTMNAEQSFFKGSRTKQAGQTDQPQPELSEQARAMFEKLVAQFNQLRETIQVIEARLVKLESGQVEEKAVKKNGHIRSFQEDISAHSKRVQR